MPRSRSRSKSRSRKKKTPRSRRRHNNSASRSLARRKRRARRSRSRSAKKCAYATIGRIRAKTYDLKCPMSPADRKEWIRRAKEAGCRPVIYQDRDDLGTHYNYVCGL